MPTHRMKLFSLLMGNSTPVPEDNQTGPPGQVGMSATAAHVPPAAVIPDAITAEPSVTPPSPHYSINLDKLRRIFQALSSLNQNKATEAEVGEEPLQMRRKYLGIFERFEMRFGHKSNNKRTRISKPKLRPKEKIMAFINSHRHNNNNPIEAPATGDDNSKTKINGSWARHNLNRITTSMRRVKSDSFISRQISKRNRRKDSQLESGEQLTLPSDKTKKRSTKSQSKALIDSASQTAHMDLINHLQANSSQHCLDDIDFWNYEYPFENLVFEGGGAKVHTYIGAIKCLEEAGIKPKRLGGTSAGAITAGLLAVGYTSEEIHILYEYDVEYNVKDGTCGLLSLLPNMFRHYGWNPGDRAMRWFGECLAVKTGNPDITFQEVLDQYGVELCIVAVNLSTRCEEYFHPKTTPEMPVKLAARMSSSLPGYFQPVRQGSNVYIDGGLLCNYPVHVFDGWWLSMAPEDVFYKRMGSLENIPQLLERKNRFGDANPKTLGFCMFSMFDDKALRFELEKRHKLKVTKRPKTKLAMKRMKQMAERDRREETRDTRLDALSRFFRVLRSAHIASGDNGLKKEDLIAAFQTQLSQPLESSGNSVIEDSGGVDKHNFTASHCEIVFGEDVDLIALLNDIPANSSGTISSGELISFLSKHNVDIQAILGYQYLGKPEVTNFGSFFMTIQESLMNSARKVYIQTEDLDRTVGINTDYIKMDDFSLDREDQEFLIQQGYKATAAFLRYYIRQNFEKPSCKSNPSSQEMSDLSGEDSDYSPLHGEGWRASDSGGEISDYETEVMVTSSSSRDTKSPCKGTPDSEGVHSTVISTENMSLQDHEEVVVAEVELLPSQSVELLPSQSEEMLCVSRNERLFHDVVSCHNKSSSEADVNVLQTLAVEEQVNLQVKSGHKRSVSSPLCRRNSDAIEILKVQQ